MLLKLLESFSCSETELELELVVTEEVVVVVGFEEQEKEVGLGTLEEEEEEEEEGDENGSGCVMGEETEESTPVNAMAAPAEVRCFVLFLKIFLFYILTVGDYFPWENYIRTP